MSTLPYVLEDGPGVVPVIDPSTGLPKLAERHVWRVTPAKNKHRTDPFGYYYSQHAPKVISTSRRVTHKVELIRKPYHVVETLDIAIRGEIEHVKPETVETTFHDDYGSPFSESTINYDVSPESILETATQIVQHLEHNRVSKIARDERERLAKIAAQEHSARMAAFEGNYPPNSVS